MSTSSNMTVRVSSKVKAKLGQLAQNTRHSKSHLAAEAIEQYVDRELDIVEGIKRGLADVEAGRIVPHDQVTEQARKIIGEAKRTKIL